VSLARRECGKVGFYFYGEKQGSWIGRKSHIFLMSAEPQTSATTLVEGDGGSTHLGHLLILQW